MEGVKFRYYIKDANNYYIYVDNDGEVQISQTPKYLKHAPKEWKQLSTLIERHPKEKGVFGKFSEAIEFVLDGKQILDHYCTIDGIQARLHFYIEKQENNNFNYEPYYNAPIDPKEYIYNEHISTCKLNDTDFISIKDANGSVVYEIELTPQNSVDLQLDGVDIYRNTTYFVANFDEDSPLADKGNHTLQLDIISNENADNRATKRVQFTGNSTIPNTGQHFHLASSNGNLTIEYNFEAFARWTTAAPAPNPATSLIWAIAVERGGSTTIITQNVLYQKNGVTDVFGVSYNTGLNHVLSGSHAMDVLQGDKLYFVCRISNTGNDNTCQITYQSTSGGDVKIISFSRSNATKHKAIRPIILWQELVTKMTNGSYGGISNALANDSNLLLIGGTGLRREAKQTIQTTITDFLKFSYVLLTAVIKECTSNTASLEALADTFIQNVSLNVGSVADLSMNFDADSLINAIKVGYPNMEIGKDSINGKFEYNQTNHFTSGQTNVNNIYDIVCPYIASIYLQEIMRTKLINLNSTDNENDNSVYLIDAELGGNEYIFYGQYTISGSPGSYIVQIPKVVLTLSVGQQLNYVAAGVTHTGTITNVSYLVLGNTYVTISGAHTTGTYIGNISFFNTNLYVPRRPPLFTLLNVRELQSQESSNVTSAYNWLITPRHILLKHKAIIASGIYNAASIANTLFIKFQSGDKNVDFTLIPPNSTGPFVQKDDVSIEDLGQPLYLPIKLKFTTDYPRYFYNVVFGSNKFELIEFVWNNKSAKGFIKRVETNEDNYEKKDWELLLNADANIIELIKKNSE